MRLIETASLFSETCLVRNSIPLHLYRFRTQPKSDICRILPLQCGASSGAWCLSVLVCRTVLWIAMRRVWAREVCGRTWTFVQECARYVIVAITPRAPIIRAVRNWKSVSHVGNKARGVGPCVQCVYQVRGSYTSESLNETCISNKIEIARIIFALEEIPRWLTGLTIYATMHKLWNWTKTNIVWNNTALNRGRGRRDESDRSRA